jgi:hypothetical protein
MIMRALAIVAALHTAALACAMPMLSDVPLTKDGTTIPDGGGVIMETVNGGQSAPGTPKLVAGKTNVRMRIDYIAPGLSVIVPKSQANRQIELVDANGKRLLLLNQSGVAPKHAAPKLVAVTSTLPAERQTNQPQPPRMYDPSGTVTIELGEAPPDDIVALVLYASLPSQQGVAWAPPGKGQKTFSFSVGGKRCSPGPIGVPQGAKVAVGWLDATGRVSVLSKEVVIKAPPPPKTK